MTDQHPDLKKPIRPLYCCCCGAHTRGRQHYNRDIGYGLCPRCIPLVTSKMSAEDVARAYGIRGIHYDVKE